MGGERTARYLVLSDLHFGTGRSSVNDESVVRALVRFIAERRPWTEVVFSGGLLDLDGCTLARSVDGQRSPRLFGFRQFLGQLDRSTRGGLAAIAARWVHLPGGDDARLLQARGPDRSASPGAVPFFRSLFRPFGAADRVQLEPSHHLVPLGGAGRTMLLTHGHDLDEARTRGPRELEALVDHLLRRTLASGAGGDVAGRELPPDALGVVWDVVLQRMGLRPASWRGQALCEAQLRHIDRWLLQHPAGAAPPAWFVFGHTHRQGQGTTPGLGVRVFNAGSAFPHADTLLTFLTAEAGGGPAGEPVLTPMCVDRQRRVRPSRLDA